MCVWLAIVALFVGGFVGIFLGSASRLAKESDMAAEVAYYRRLAEREKED